jgi:serpin B
VIQAQHEAVGTATAGFGLRLLDRIAAGRPGDNVVLSPLSVHAALATVREGAAGAARAALDEVLDGASGHDHAELRRDLIARDEAVELALAQSVWVDERYELAPEFAAVAEELGVATGGRLDAAAVNAWAAEQTRGMIPSVVESFDADEKLALADAAYMAGTWTEPFDPELTEARPFTRPDGSAVDVPSMSATGRFEYAEEDGIQAIRLPYGNSRELAFIAVLGGPPDDWRGLREAMSQRDGRVELPRLHAESQLELTDVLIDLGLGPAFEPGGDWEGLFRGEGRKALSRVLQRARVEVDEEGTRAAAVTVVTARAVSAVLDPPPPFELKLDRPFLWAIEDAASGTLLFLGIVRDPSRDQERRP